MNKLAIAFVGAVSLISSANASQNLVTQHAKAFSKSEISVSKGDIVTFRNDDEFVHNIFTLTEPMFFDLGTFPKGQSRSVTFDQVGEFTIECAIHPEMQMLVRVQD